MKPGNIFAFAVIPVLVLALAVMTALLVVQQTQASQRQGDAIRSVLCFFEVRALQSPQLSAKQKQEAVRIYAQALETIDQRPC